jgi:hypothetical protein
MEHERSSGEEIEYSIDFLLAIERKIQEGTLPTIEEEQRLRETLKNGSLPLDQEQRVIAVLNPQKAPVVILNDEQRKEYLLCSHGTNYRIHLPRGGWGYDIETLVFERNTGLYYIQKPESIEILE